MQLKVLQALSDKKDFDDLYYESIITYIELMLDFDYWEEWTSFLLSANGPMISEEMDNNLDIVHRYILKRIWIGTYSEFENSVKEFDNIIVDLREVFHRHSDYEYRWYKTEKYYHFSPYDVEIGNKLLEDYKSHVCLVDNLVFELTRSANRMCSLTRKHINSMYRLSGGKMLATEKCPEYRDGEHYLGIDDFIQVYNTRDVYRGIINHSNSELLANV